MEVLRFESVCEVSRRARFFVCYLIEWGCGALMVSALDSGASAPGSSPHQGHYVAFLGKTLHSHSAYLHPGV